MILAGLDQSLRKSGAAVLDGQRFVRASALSTTGDHAAAFSQFRKWWIAFLKDNGVQRVALEQPLRSDMMREKIETIAGKVVKIKVPMTNMDTLLGLYGVRAHAIQICDALKIPCVEVNNREWRKLIYGVSSAPKGTRDTTAWWKAQAIERCRLLSWPVTTNDAAEAALIAEWLRVTTGPLGRTGKPDLFERVPA